MSLFCCLFGAKRGKSTVYHRFAKVRPKASGSNGKHISANSREHVREQGPKTGRLIGPAPDITHNTLHVCILHNNKSFLQAFCSPQKFQCHETRDICHSFSDAEGRIEEKKYLFTKL